MKPYYEHAGITIFQGDCREVIGCLSVAYCRACGCELTDEAILAIHLAAGHDVGPLIDAVVADPPYGSGFVHGPENIPNASKFSGIPIIGDDEPFDPSHLLKFEYVMLWGANHYADRLPVRDGRWLVWDKRCGVTGERDMGDCEMAWVRGSGGSASRMFRHFWDGFNRESERGIPRVHPTQKPEALMSWCLKFVPAGRVLDPYMGSGSTLIACKKQGRSAIGIEIEEKYCEIAAKRLSQEVLDFNAPQPSTPTHPTLYEP